MGAVFFRPIVSDKFYIKLEDCIEKFGRMKISLHSENLRSVCLPFFVLKYRVNKYPVKPVKTMKWACSRFIGNQEGQYAR